MVARHRSIRERWKSLNAQRVTLSFWALSAFLAIDLALVAACVVALKSNVALKQNEATEKELLGPMRGIVAPPITGTNWYGAPQSITYGQNHNSTFIYTFATNCYECAIGWDSIRQLQEVSSGRLRMVYIDISEKLPSEFLAARGIPPSWLLTNISPESRLAYGARSVPQSELLDRTGRVVWAHVGPFGSAAANQVLAALAEDNPTTLVQQKEKP